MSSGNILLRVGAKACTNGTRQCFDLQRSSDGVCWRSLHGICIRIIAWALSLAARGLPDGTYSVMGGHR